MIKGKKVSIIFPAYNEEKNIAQAIDDFKKLRFIDEVIVVDNNSKDNTKKIAIRKRVKVVTEKKQGYGYALRKGLSVATGTYIFLCEPDGTFRATDAKKLLKYSDRYDVVIGTRTNKKFVNKSANMHGVLRWGNIILAKLIQFLYRPSCSLSDCGCTFRLIKKNVVKKILPQMTVGGSHFLSELLVLILKTNYKVVEVPLHYEKRIGESKITGSMKRSIQVGFSMLKIVLTYKFQTLTQNHNKFLIFLILSTVIFCTAIATNISPLLLGPGPYPPNWRWDYQPTPLSLKIVIPLLIIAGILWTIYRYEKTKRNKPAKLITILIINGFLLQIGLLFANRAGIPVLLHRIINPTINGYFTVSLSVQSLPFFLQNFNESMGSYPMYAKFHPPGAILFFSFINAFASTLHFIFPIIAKVTPRHSDVAAIWIGLTDAQKTSAFLSGFIIALLSYITLIPFYFSAKVLYGKQTALRSVFLFMFVPSVLLFVPLNDVFLPIFTVWSLYYFLVGMQRQNLIFSFLSGLVLFFGTFFSLTFLPLLLFFFIFLFSEARSRQSINSYLSFLIGFIIPPFFFLLFYQLDFIGMIQQMMQFHQSAQSGRHYWIWLIYNIYDFFIFVGIPITVLFIYQLFSKTKDKLFFSFIIMFIILDITGSVRAETGRIWLPFVPFIILIVANFITNSLKLSSKQFILILFLQAMQVVIFQAFLLTVW